MFAGLDVGSRTIKLVTLDPQIIEQKVVDSGVNPIKRCQELLQNQKYERLVVTGYGRHLVAPAVGGEVVSEIKAFALGTHHLLTASRTVIDIGGQDTKVISIGSEGEVIKFEMNDRCAAGTGKFLEIMARTLEIELSNFGGWALNATKKVRINSLCTVFAESEVVSLIAKGEESNAIALGLHEAIATRIATMAQHVGLRKEIAFVGGGALNKCLHELLKEKLGMEIARVDNPQTVGALGAALLASH
jgi:(R)-2-hydroxyacyl-CoA dehydratese activating ATPase